MGGKNQQTVENPPVESPPRTPNPRPTPKPRSSDIPPASGTSRKIRWHESGGEVHFHDDERGLKVAIPVATVWDEWQRFKKEKKPIRFEDQVNNTCAIITPLTVHDVDHDRLDARIDIEEFKQVEFSGVLAELDKFVSKTA